jgi:Rrf2 family protein
VRISAKADYAVRAALELAAAAQPPTKGERLAEAQGIPLKFLENILGDLRQSGLVLSQRGPDGGYRLERPPEEITVADVIRAVDGPLASVRSQRPEAMHYAGPAEELAPVWIALRAAVRGVLEHVTLRDIVEGHVPAEVAELARDPGAWKRR